MLKKLFGFQIRSRVMKIFRSSLGSIVYFIVNLNRDMEECNETSKVRFEFGI